MAATTTAAVTGLQNRFQGSYGEALIGALGYAAGLTPWEAAQDPGWDLILEDSDGELARFQVKTTTKTLAVVDGALRYDVDIPTYDRLRKPTTVPGFLILVDVRAQQREWAVGMQWGFILRERARYVSLLGLPDVDNATSVTVSLPLDNMVTPTSLAALVTGVA